MPRYALVGCSKCTFLFVTGTDHERVTCRRCGASHRLDALRRLAAADDRERVVEARSRRLRERVSGG